MGIWAAQRSSRFQASGRRARLPEGENAAVPPAEERSWMIADEMGLRVTHMYASEHGECLCRSKGRNESRAEPPCRTHAVDRRSASVLSSLKCTCRYSRPASWNGNTLSLFCQKALFVGLGLKTRATFLQKRDSVFPFQDAVRLYLHVRSRAW